MIDDADRAISAADMARIDARCRPVHGGVQSTPASRKVESCRRIQVVPAVFADDDTFLRRLTPTPKRYRKITINEARKALKQ
jgi:hypothetical protein